MKWITTIARLFQRPAAAVGLSDTFDLDAFTQSIACHCYGCEQQRKAHR